LKTRTLRWRLILFSWSLAFGTALLLTVLLHARTRRQLLQQLERNLESRFAEVVIVLQSGQSYPTLQEFLHIETTNAPTYFYDIRDAQGRSVAISENLGGFELPQPAWRPEEDAAAVEFRTVANPVSPRTDRIRLRSQRVRITPPGRDPATVVVQTAVTLGAFEHTMRGTLREALLIAAGGLVGVFFLLWFVTTRALQPVAAITRKASQITATNVRERLPQAGRGDELDELARVLNDMLDRLGGSLRQMEQFSSDAAHQLRTPLTRIRGELDLVLRCDVPGPSRSQLERVQEEIEGMSRLCGRLLLLARLDQQAGNAGVCDERVDLGEMVSEVLEQMTPLAQDRGVGLRRDATAAAIVRGSRPLLVEALLNLLDNAIRITPSGGSVAITLSADGEVQLSVEDSGPGIPPAERERVFQRFYRLPRASPEATDDGYGLGLAIVAGIAKAHGGRVELVEALEGGSVFRLVLPRHPAS
jgi:two-component system, OmpR family, sensor kinase